MGVKSTVRITRKQAVARMIDYRQREELKRLEWEFASWSNKELEDELERLNDRYFELEYGGSYGGFDNYLIVPDDELDD